MSSSDWIQLQWQLLCWHQTNLVSLIYRGIDCLSLSVTVPSDQSGTIASLCYRVLAQDSDKVPIVNKNHISHSRETDSNRLLSTLFTKNRIRSYIRVKEGNAPPQAPCCGFPQFPREIRETRTGGDFRFPLFPRQKKPLSTPRKCEQLCTVERESENNRQTNKQSEK